jgi:hypothetical protein
MPSILAYAFHKRAATALSQASSTGLNKVAVLAADPLTGRTLDRACPRLGAEVRPGRIARDESPGVLWRAAGAYRSAARYACIRKSGYGSVNIGVPECQQD